MAHAYTPGLQVAPRIRFLARRALPISGEVVKQVGDWVQARDVVARTLLPGDVFPINLANQLSVSPGETARHALVKPGDRVAVGQLLGRTPGIFGMFQTEYRSATAGTIESISGMTGQCIIRGEPIPVQVRAYASGEVVELIPGEGVVVQTDASLIQGIFGIGGEAYGQIRLACERPDEDLTPARLSPDMKGMIVVGGARIHGATVHRAVELGISALIAGGIDDQDLKEILGYDLGVAITGTEQIGITVIITEGFGDIAMAQRTFDLLAARQGSEAACNGATQIRAGVLRPEILIPLVGERAADLEVGQTHGGGVLNLGVAVRMIRDPYFGRIGRVVALPHEQRELGTGSHARVLEVECPGGERLIVPRANVEIVGE